MFFSVLVCLFLAGAYIAWHEQASHVLNVAELKKPAWIFINGLTFIGIIVAFVAWSHDVRDAAALAASVPLGALVYTYGRIIARNTWTWLRYNFEPLDASGTRCYADGNDLANRHLEPRAQRAKQLELAVTYHQQS